MISLDNAATSFPKPKNVIREVERCITRYCGNPGRGSHKLALAAADRIFDTRVAVSEFLGTEKCENVIFTANATHALNLVIKGLITEKCHCITSDLEHNSVIRPLYKMLDKYDGTLSVFNSDFPVTDAIEPLIQSDTKIIISTLCSNVTGKIINLSELSAIAKKHGLKLVLDASQYLGHAKINLEGTYYTAICSAGHKSLFGIQGSAFAAINEDELFDTLMEGGSGVDSFSRVMPILMPERYEAGTLSTPAIVSLGAGIDYLNSIGMTEVEHHIKKMTDLLYEVLVGVPRLTLYGAENGIASFNLYNLRSSYVSDVLDKRGILTRPGFHCAPLIHQKLGTNEYGAVRVSLSYFNSDKDIYELGRALKDLC